MSLRPDFAIIGAMKCGTSSLHAYLDLHPEIGMSTPKEPSFFVETMGWPKGLDWYSSIFPEGSRVRGESSTNYTKNPNFPGVPERMKGVVPDAKVVYLVRDPLARIRSHWIHNVAHGRERRSFVDALTPLEGNHYVQVGLYRTQIAPWIETFGRDSVLISSLEHLSTRRGGVIRRVFEFLDVDPDFRHEGFESHHHASSQKRRATAFGRRLDRFRRVRRAFLRLAPKLVETPIERPEIPDDLREALAEIYRPEIEGIRELAGSDLGLPDLGSREKSLSIPQ